MKAPRVLFLPPRGREELLFRPETRDRLFRHFEVTAVAGLAERL